VKVNGQEVTDPTTLASLKYYKSLTALLDQLRKQKAPLNKMGYWYEKYSKSVEELPVLNVDPDLLGIGNEIGATLRSLSLASRSTSGSVNVLENTKGNYMLNYGNPGVVNVGNWGGGYGNSWGYSYYDPGQVMVDNTYTNAMKQNASVMGLNAYKTQAWSQMDAAMAAVRKRLTEKYRVEF
jgi:hypothetical protein